MKLLNLLVVFSVSIIALAAAEPERLSDIVTMPDRPRPYYKVHMIGQDPMICEFFEEDKQEGKITFAVAGTGIRQTQTNNRLEKVEPKITPAELVELRGAELLKAHPYPKLHLDAQRELLQMLNWATETDEVNFGKEKVAAPKKEALEIAIKAAEQYPENFDILDRCLAIADELSDERLEKILIENIKRAPRWDNGYARLATLLDDADRDQELMAFVKGWLGRMRSSQRANSWAMRIALANNNTEMAKESARRLWLRKKDPQAGSELAKILLLENKGDEALAIANEVLELDADREEMKIIAGSALLAKGDLAGAKQFLGQVSQSSNPKLQSMAQHNLGVLSWVEGDVRGARQKWKGLTHPATNLARAIANKTRVKDRAVTGHPALAMTAAELNAALSLQNEAPAEALSELRPNHSTRHTFLKRIAELIQSNYGEQEIKLLNAYHTEESTLWRAYGYIQRGEFAKAEALLADLPQDHGYAAVYRVFCAEGLGDPERAEQLFTVAQSAKDAPANYISELESYYLSMKSSKELELFKWPAGDRLKTGWFSEAPKTGIHIFAQGEYLAFTGIQKAEAVSRAWRKRSKERLRRIVAEFDPADGWSGLELVDDKAQNGLAIAIEKIGEERQVVWRRLSGGKWANVWNNAAAAGKNEIVLLLDDSLIGNEQIQLLDASGSLHPLSSLSDIPGPSMRVGFFTYAPSDTEIEFKAKKAAV